MIVGSIARRYAKALLQIGVADKSTDALAKELEQVGDLYVKSRELALTLENPIFPLDKRRGVVEEIARRLGLSRILRNFLLLLLDRGRIGSLPGIVREFRTLADVQAGRIRVQVTAARPLDPGVELRLKSALEKRSGKQVVLEKHEDPSLIGGIVTQVGDLVYDGSVRTQLATLKHELLFE